MGGLVLTRSIEPGHKKEEAEREQSDQQKRWRWKTYRTMPPMYSLKQIAANGARPGVAAISFSARRCTFPVRPFGNNGKKYDLFRHFVIRQTLAREVP